MPTIEVIYENGVFRPLSPVDVAESTKGQVVIPEVGPSATGPASLYEILDRRYNTGNTDTAARHNEHQP